MFFVNPKRLSFSSFVNFFYCIKYELEPSTRNLFKFKTFLSLVLVCTKRNLVLLRLAIFEKSVEHDISQLKFKKLLVFKYWSGNNQVGNMPANHLPHSNAAAQNVLNAFQSKSRAPSNATNASLPGSSITRGSVVDPC